MGYAGGAQKRSRVGAFKRFATQATAYAGRAALQYGRKRLVSALSDRMSRSMGGSTAPLTGNFDYKTDYRKRRLTRGKRRAQRRRRKWRGKIVSTVRKSTVATTHIVNRSLGELTSAPELSEITSYGLYGLNGQPANTFNSTNDIGQIFSQMDPTSWSNANALVNSTNHKVYSMSATMEMTVRNTGQNDAIVEAYFVRPRRGVPAIFDSPATLYDQGFKKQAIAHEPNNNTVFGLPTSELKAKDIGVTPFQNSLFTKYFNIYKRQKFRIPPGNEISFIVRESRPRTFSMATARAFSMDRAYNGVLFQFQGPPQGTGEVGLLAQATTLSFLSVRRYRFKFLRDNIERDALMDDLNP